MTKTFKRLLSALLVFTLLICGTVPVLAVDDEEYISDLRIIYADNYDEAFDILESSEFDDYKLLDVNLNENTGKTGVWLAYQVTTDIEEAITDISVMEMQGGFARYSNTIIAGRIDLCKNFHEKKSQIFRLT